MNAVCRRMIHTDSTLKNILCVLAGSSVGKETVSYTCTVLRKDYNVLNSSQSISQNTKYYWYPIYLIAVRDIFFRNHPTLSIWATLSIGDFPSGCRKGMQCLPTIWCDRFFEIIFNFYPYLQIQNVQQVFPIWWRRRLSSVQHMHTQNKRDGLNASPWKIVLTTVSTSHLLLVYIRMPVL